MVHDCPKYVDGDLFAEIKKAPVGHKILIPHVVNNLGKWGAGFSGPLGEHFPVARRDYLMYFGGGFDGIRAKGCLFLGDTRIVWANEGIRVANMVAQDGVGTSERRIRYDALVRCMEEVAKIAAGGEYAIHAPKFGAGLAGGNWDFIEELIRDCWIRRGIEVTVYWMPEKGRKR